MYDADAAREALDEAKRFDKSNGSAAEKAESWAVAAQRFEEGMTQDRFAASQSITCWRRANNLAKAVECAELALETFGGDPWVRNNAAWVQYDKLKKLGRNADEALTVLERMLDLMRGLSDVGLLADSAAFRLRYLVPLNDTASPDVLDFLMRHFEQLFDGCRSVGRDGRESAKLQLAQFAATNLEAHERWDDLVVAMRRVVEAYPRDAVFARKYVRALLEMQQPEEALTAAQEALLEVADAELVRLQARALASLGRHAEAAEALLSGCYRFGDVWLWRDVAKVRWQLGDVAGSNRALAVALRQVPKLPLPQRRPLAPRLHQGRAAGLVRLGELAQAAQEAAAARLAYEEAGEEPEPALAAVVAQIVEKEATALDAADDLAEAQQLFDTLAQAYAAAREDEVEASLRPAEVVHLDLDKGFGYLVATDASEPNAATAMAGQSEGEGAEPPRIHFATKSFQGDPAQLAVGSRVRMFAAAVTNADAKQFGTRLHAVVVRPM